MSVSLLLLVAAAHAGCPSSRDAVAAEVDRALDAYSALDLPAFDRAAARVEEEASCLGELATPALAARIHLVAALSAWIDKDGPRTLAGFQGMRAADPAAELDPTLAPPGSRPRVFFETAQGGGSHAGVPIAPEPGATWAVDGTLDVAPTLPTDRAVLVQRMDETDRVARSWYFPTGATLAAVQPPEVPMVPPPPARKMSARRSLRLGVGLGTAGAGILALTGALVMKEAYVDAPPDEGRLEGLYAANLVVGTAGFVACAGGAALVTGSIVGRW